MSKWITVEDSLKGRARAVERERERIIQLLIDADTTNLTTEELKGWYFALTVIKGEKSE
jgi:hypothetical protein